MFWRSHNKNESFYYEIVTGLPFGYINIFVPTCVGVGYNNSILDKT